MQRIGDTVQAHRSDTPSASIAHWICANTDSLKVLPHRLNTTAEPVPVGSFWMPPTISNDTKDDLQEPRPPGRL